MSISKILVRAYCVLEFVAALLVTALVIGMRVADPIHDRAEYLDYWEMGLIGLAWMFFISLPDHDQYLKKRQKATDVQLPPPSSLNFNQKNSTILCLVSEMMYFCIVSEIKS